jgi:hypothetical protein
MVKKAPLMVTLVSEILREEPVSMVVLLSLTLLYHRDCAMRQIMNRDRDREDA